MCHCCMSKLDVSELHSKAGPDMHVLQLQAAQGLMARSLHGLMGQLLVPRQVTPLLLLPAPGLPFPPPTI